MLLSIDRVLQLLIEDKTLDKIAELADCTVDDVKHVLEESRHLLQKHEKDHARKKIILKKHRDDSAEGTEEVAREIFEGAELSAVPLGSVLTIYIDGASRGNPGPSGIGIVILDSDDRQVGKVSARIGFGTNNTAEYQALIRALRIAIYFETKRLKIRTDSELIVKQIDGSYSVKNEAIKKLYATAIGLMKQIPHCRIEHVTRSLNDKADYLAKKATDPYP
ncbi:MAG: ribonuclease HI family protein [Spirochaetes bacterium]|nr:ribonuclease HI family protein [Spirochaetota bacterium]